MCILQSGRSLKFDISATKRAFYAACNSILMHDSGINEIALLCLQDTIVFVCLRMPFLLDELNVCWNSVVRKVFGYHKWESVSAVLLGLPFR